MLFGGCTPFCLVLGGVQPSLWKNVDCDCKFHERNSLSGTVLWTQIGFIRFHPFYDFMWLLSTHKRSLQFCLEGAQTSEQVTHPTVPNSEAMNTPRCKSSIPTADHVILSNWRAIRWIVDARNGRCSLSRFCAVTLTYHDLLLLWTGTKNWHIASCW